MERRRPAYQPRNLAAAIFGEQRAASSARPPTSSVRPPSTSIVPAAPEAQPAAEERERPRKRARGKSPVREDQPRQSLAIRERARAEEPVRSDASLDRRSDSPRAVVSAEPEAFKPNLELWPGRPLNVEDKVVRNAAVISALGRACALPRDVERHREEDSPQLLMRTLQHSLLAVQRLPLVLDRMAEDEGKLNRLAAEKQQAETALAAKCEELKETEAKRAELDAQVVSAVCELSQTKAESITLQERLVAEMRRSAELEAELEREKAAREENLASQQAEIDAAFLEGTEHAGRDYTDQITQLSRQLFHLGCRASLKEYGVPEDHPLYMNPPEFRPPTPAETTASPPPETPASPLPEIPASLPPEIPAPPKASSEAVPKTSGTVATVEDAVVVIEDTEAETS